MYLRCLVAKLLNMLIQLRPYGISVWLINILLPALQPEQIEYNNNNKNTCEKHYESS